jgi:CubicO group peptidase (beta-lactamase class C family)
MHPLLAVVLLSLPQARSGTDSIRSARAVDSIFAPFTRGIQPGAAVLVRRDGRVLHQAGYGYADIGRKARIGPETRFLLGSVSKQFTAMTVMILAEQGRLSLDDRLRKLVPEFPQFADSITVADLLHHLGGLPEYEELFVELGRVDRDWPRSVTTPRSRFEPTARDALALLAEHGRPVFPAGERYQYSNSGYMVLAQIVERVTGQRFAGFIRSAVFDPLGMTATLLYDETTGPVPGRASSYAPGPNGFKEIDYTPFNFIYGEDNVVAPIGDLAGWLGGLEPDRLVSAGALERAFTPGRTRDGKSTGYGFGWVMGRSLGVPVQGHGGSWLGFRTAIRRYPEQRLEVVVLANRSDADAETLAARVASIYLGPALRRRTAVALPPARRRALLGTYRIGERLVATVESRSGGTWFISPLGRDRIAFDSDSTAFFVENPASGLTFRRTGGGVTSLVYHRLETDFELTRVR